jgi:hypothetical protein
MAAISGSVTLLEAAKWGDDLLKKGVVEIIIRESPILETLPMITIQGNALKSMLEDTLPSVSFRDVNATYNRDFGTDREIYWGTAILGGEVFVDNYIVRTRGNLGDVKARQYQKKAKAAALTFDKYFFKGTGTASDFKGVNQLISEGHGQLVSAADYVSVDSQANGATLVLDDLDYAHDALRTGTADAILGNRTNRRKITKLARTSVTGVSLIDIGDDTFGRQIMQWNGIPYRIIGDGPDGNLILGFNETRGNQSASSSLYFVRYGADEFVSGLMGAGGAFEVVDFGETEAAPGHMGRIEFYPGIAVFSKWAVVQLQGILAG